jgi:dTDP-4-amino-4,6-dideoxygalactose transaminase
VVTTDSVRTIPFHVPDLPDVDAYLADVRGIVTSGRHGYGPYRERLETEIAPLVGGGQVVAVSNCSNGLIAALSVVTEGGPTTPAASPERGEVVIPSYTYLATWQAVGWAGLEPVVADVDDRGLLDPDAVAAAVTPRTRAILGVHVFGLPADLPGLRAVADRAGVPLVFDAAHALGARWVDRPVGAGGDIEVFSLGPTKQLGSLDGGLIVVNRPELAEAARRFANQGHVVGDLDAVGPGLNIGMGELSAALALRGLPDLDRRIARRSAIRDVYAAGWADLPLRLPAARPGERGAVKDQVVWLDDAADRDPLRRHLAAAGIQTKPYYDPAIPDLTAFRGRVSSGERGRDLARRSVAVPIHGRLDDDDVGRIVDAVRGFWS